MRTSALFLSVALIASVGGAFGAGFLVGRNQPVSKSVARNLPTAIPTTGPDDLVQQNGKIVSLTQLLAVYRENPNRFSLISGKSIFHIEGHIAKVGEASAGDDISGFYVPLVSSNDPVERAVADMQGKGEFSEPVSIFVKGMSNAQIASLNPGQIIRVDCPRMRIVTNGFVFDDCHLAKDKSK